MLGRIGDFDDFKRKLYDEGYDMVAIQKQRRRLN
jgi:hypothetical protein